MEKSGTRSRQRAVWKELLLRLNEELETLPDKPEETPETTLQALWWAACGDPKSVQAACHLSPGEISSEQRELLRDLIEQRLNGIPLAHITGRQHFMGLELLASPDALVPRKETELLGKAALGLLLKMSQKIDPVVFIDVCTGAGNLAVSLASSVSEATGYASDLSEEAVELAWQNINRFYLEGRVDARVGDLLSPFDSDEFYGKVDLITCNPPYISSAKLSEMPHEISDNEPRLAFDGGPFGVMILRRLIKEAPEYLKDGGWLAFEVGLGQGEKIIKQLGKSLLIARCSPSWIKMETYGLSLHKSGVE
jgi:release factor glutamine methyltransferase